MLLNLLAPSTLCGQLIQASIQIIVWLAIFKKIKSTIRKNYGQSSWYLHAIKKGDGEEEFLMVLVAIPQHSVSAIFIWFGIYFNSLQLFTMGMLGEFSFEFIELYNILMSKYVYHNCKLSDEMVKSLIFHHLPGVLVIIPTNLYFGDNIYIQKIAFSLLAVAPPLAVFFVLFKTRNVYDLQQRGQFTVYFFICILIMIVTRFYWTPSYMIQFLIYDFMSLNTFAKIMFLFYGLLITLFNITFVLILSKRLYGFLYCNKYVVEKKELIKNFKQPRPIIKRCKSNPILESNESNKIKLY
eukprot:260831_1